MVGHVIGLSSDVYLTICVGSAGHTELSLMGTIVGGSGGGSAFYGGGGASACLCE